MALEEWLAELLGQSRPEVRRLLRDSSALHFLIVWSIFESKCFDGYVKIAGIEEFAARLESESYDSNAIAEIASHFHARYQDRDRYRRLMHGTRCDKLDAVLERNLASARPGDAIFLVAVVAYRFRNNMFHGNKGVASWLRYKEQIHRCTDALQSFVSHAEALKPSLRDAA